MQKASSMPLMAVSVMFAASACLAATLVVAPNGNNTNPGTRLQPLASLDAARDADPEQGMLAERRAYERCLVTEDRREALRAIRERRPPRFRGK